MTCRSERNKIRFQAAWAVIHCDEIQGNLKYIDELAVGRSEIVNQHLPSIVFMVDELKKLLGSFRSAL